MKFQSQNENSQSQALASMQGKRVWFSFTKSASHDFKTKTKLKKLVAKFVTVLLAIFGPDTVHLSTLDIGQRKFAKNIYLI